MEFGDGAPLEDGPARAREAREQLLAAARERILILDGAMGTQIQGLRLEKSHFRGERFVGCECHLQGNNDLLTLTQPQAIEDIHFAYAHRRRRHPRDQHLLLDAHRAGRLRHAGRRLRTQSRRRAAGPPRRAQGGARSTASAASSPARSGRPTAPRRCRPTSTIPAFAPSPSTICATPMPSRSRGLIDGGADIILIETIFDTLNAKAAIFACEKIFAERGVRLPMMISGTITDRSGRTLSGQTPTAFWHSVRHARPFSIGLNCALGADGDARASRRDRRRRRHARLRLSERRPAQRIRPLRREPGVDGRRRSAASPATASSTSSAAAAARRPSISAAIAEAVRGVRAARDPDVAPLMRLSGLEPFTLTKDIPFVNVGERTNVTGSAKFRKLITAGDYAGALAVARDQVANGAQIIDVNMDEGLIDSRGGDGRVPQPRRRRARHRPRAGDDRFARNSR